jgi:2-phospho-L-lactate guanylyltransferase
VEGAWRIVVPLRLSDAKSRLSAQPAPRRRDLVIAMALDVIVAAQECPAVSDIVLVADEAGIDAVAASPIPTVRTQLDGGAGLNAAILAGTADARGPVAALLADVPCATPEALTTALAACTAGAVIVSDAEGIGTTLLAARDAAHFHPRFGTRSRAAHVAAGAAEVADSSPGALAGLRRDVDSEVDLWDARRLGLGTFTRAVLSDT